MTTTLPARFHLIVRLGTATVEYPQIMRRDDSGLLLD
jgi:hypothetical protein